MLFNTLNFFYFLALVLALFWLIDQKYRKALVLISSYIYLASFSILHCIPLLISTIVDYYFSLKIASDQLHKKKYLLLSIFFNLSLLFYFKYIILINEVLNRFFGLTIDPESVINLSGNEELILPIAISFYTFQTLSYTFDVYQRKINPTRNFIEYALYVSYFPQLIAGPIEKAANLMPKLNFKESFKKIDFNMAIYYISLGLFKKVVVANNLSVITESLFTTHDSNFVSVTLSGFVYYIRLYCDFSGYVDMATGISLLFGVKLSLNFATPYLKTSISKFWRSWHITLSNWIKDYIYIPLGGDQNGSIRTYLNLFIAIVLAGIWHGASLAFVIFGLYHFFMVAINHLFRNKIPSIIAYPLTLISVSIGFAIFNLKSYDWLSGLLNIESISEQTMELSIYASALSITYFLPILLLEISKIKENYYFKFTASLVLLFLVLIFGNNDSTSFIYFRF